MLPLTREGLREELRLFAREQLNEQLREQGRRTREDIRTLIEGLPGSASGAALQKPSSGAQAAGPNAELQERLQEALTAAAEKRGGGSAEAQARRRPCEDTLIDESGDAHEWTNRHFKGYTVKEADAAPQIGPMMSINNNHASAQEPLYDDKKKGISLWPFKSNGAGQKATTQPPQATPAGYGLRSPPNGLLSPQTLDNCVSASAMNGQNSKVTSMPPDPPRIAWNSEPPAEDGVASENMVKTVHVPLAIEDKERVDVRRLSVNSNQSAESAYSTDTMDFVIPRHESNEANRRRTTQRTTLRTEDDSKRRLSSTRASNKAVYGGSRISETQLSLDEDRDNVSQWRLLADAIICSYHFETISGIAVILNAISIGVETDYVARHELDDSPMPFRIIEMIFCVVFTAEIVLRLYTHRCLFFTMSGRWWNLFDLLVVSLQLMEEFMNLIVAIWKSADSGQKLPTNFSMLRVLRILRLIRIMRLIRVLRLIGELRTIVCSIAGSMKSLFWTVALLFMLIYLVAIYLTQLVLDYKLGLEESASAPLNNYYGSLSSSILSLYQSMTGGIDWENMVTPLIRDISPLLGLVFSLYIAFAVLCLMNVVTGVFVEAALLSAKQDKDIYMVNHARDLFTALDTDGSGQLSWREFKEQLHTKDMQEYFKAIDVDPSEAKGLFRLLDINRTGSIDAEAFLSATFRLRGPAKALDLALLMHETRRMNQSYMAHAHLVETYLTCLATVLPVTMPTNLSPPKRNTREVQRVSLPQSSRKASVSSESSLSDACSAGGDIVTDIAAD